MFFWLRHAGVLLVLLGAVALFPGVSDTPSQLFAIAERLWPQADTVRQAWRAPYAGETSLSPRVHSMLRLLRQQRIDSFRYSAALAAGADASLPQRIAESAFPIRIHADARHLLLLAGEVLDPRCTVTATDQELVLATCS